ncbi:hypothetical protein ACF1AO_34195 [Streptomyces longwoodensis]|uniref:hypothetical protein n=1 Tax=Streptomyces longwoodensis TaxID=68231 RepID=UPI003702DD83
MSDSAIDRAYIEDHMESVHTPDSFGRAVADMLMRAAMAEIGDGKQEIVEFKADVVVKRRVARRAGELDCLTVALGVPPISVGVHWGL